VNVLGRNAKVCELLGDNMNWWNMDLVNEVFNDEKANMICSLGLAHEEGQISWHGKNKKM
jgi:hypothetical protein